jgi:uncharacterized membrane-anchored protein YitT (DUF2179 family)
MNKFINTLLIIVTLVLLASISVQLFFLHNDMQALIKAIDGAPVWKEGW